MFEKSHGDLALRLPRLNASFDFFWVASLGVAVERDATLVRDAAPALWGGARAYDAVFISAGLWDVGLRGPGGAAAACVAADAVRAALAALPPRARAAALVWSTPYPEAVWNEGAGALETDRFPAAALDAVNACTLRAARDAGVATFDTAALLRAPAAARARAAPPRSRAFLPLPAPGAVLTIDGYHPGPVARAALWRIFENAAAARWAADAAAGAPPAAATAPRPARASRRGRAPAAAAAAIHAAGALLPAAAVAAAVAALWGWLAVGGAEAAAARDTAAS